MCSQVGSFTNVALQTDFDPITKRFHNFRFVQKGATAYALDRLGNRVVIGAAHSMQNFKLYELRYTRALWVIFTPASAFGQAPQQLQPLSLQQLMHMGSIPAIGCKITDQRIAVLFNRLKMAAGFQLAPGEPSGYEDDVAVVYLQQPFVLESQSLRAHTAHLEGRPDVLGKVGLVVGFPGDPYNPDRPWYSVLGPPPQGQSMSFDRHRGVQTHDGWSWEGMSGGPVVVYDRRREGANLSSHVNLCISTASVVSVV